MWGVLHVRINSIRMELEWTFTVQGMILSKPSVL